MSQSIRFDPEGIYAAQNGLNPSDVAGLASTLEKLRDELCLIEPRILAGDMATPADRQPLGSGFYGHPARLLTEYEADRQGSDLARVLAFTKQMMTEVDRVVVIGAGSATLAAQAVLQSCCQPYFNELTRGQRGSRPRIYFAGDDLDNDALQGLLYLVDDDGRNSSASEGESWGLVLIGDADESLATQIAASRFLAVLQQHCAGVPERLTRRLVTVARSGSPLCDLAAKAGGTEFYEMPSGVGTRYAALTLAGLLPAALMGVNVMKLLVGARTISEQFSASRASESIVLQYAAINYLMFTMRSTAEREYQMWTPALEAAGRWATHVVSGSLKSDAPEVGLVSRVASCDLAAGERAHCSSRVIHQVAVEGYRFDPLPIDSEQMPPVESAESIVETLPCATKWVFEQTQQKFQADGQPATCLLMPYVDELRMGQYFQWIMLATVIEARLKGINPYA